MKKPIFRPVLLLALAALIALHLSAASAETPFADTVQLRGSLDNSRLQFQRTGKGNVAFMGGSITEMNGYRPMVCALLKKRFPNTNFKFTDAGISSTTSTTGAFRLEHDVLSEGPVDLFFVEFAVNDDQDGHHTRAECIRGMEGIVRHVWRANPNTDIVITFFVNQGMLKTLQSGKTPLTMEAHETVAQHYNVSTINLAQEVATEITAGALTWKVYGGVHPAPAGNAIAAKMIEELFNRAWAAPLTTAAKPMAHSIPDSALDALNYESGRFIDPKQAQVKQGWTLGLPNWKTLPGSKRARFNSMPMLCATEAGAETTLSFEGTAVGAYIVAGPDAGVAEASVDGGPFEEVNLFHAYSKGLHYPRTVMLGTGLKPGLHTLTLRISEKTMSAGHAMRIMHFVAN